MSYKNNSRSRSSKKNTTKRVKRTLPSNISWNTGDTYRVRKQVNGQYFDKTFNKLKDAKAMLKLLA